ncbi:hypothetical protein Ptr902_14214 [Pyrenophora tritici-repentis]|nr:hypothetical protein Ptr902_14214 [Pyrenophora tritici-repentis]
MSTTSFSAPVVCSALTLLLVVRPREPSRADPRRGPRHPPPAAAPAQGRNPADTLPQEPAGRSPGTALRPGDRAPLQTWYCFPCRRGEHPEETTPGPGGGMADALA